jgi:hypothetical protein
MSVSEYANTGNPHYKAACLDAMSDQARILQATLALAYEQRTANLIALFGKTHPNGAGAFPHPMLEAAQREIQERLGF